jgi:hypothetical protein
MQKNVGQLGRGKIVSRLGKDEEVGGGGLFTINRKHKPRDFCVLPFQLGILAGTNHAVA